MVNNNLEEIKNESLRQASLIEKGTFKVVVKRADKTFPYHSDEVVRAIGSNFKKY